MPEILDEIIENLETESGFLIHVNSDELDREIIDILNFFTNKKKLSCVYISTNRAYKTLKMNFEKKGINTKNIFFIDVIEAEPKEKIENVLFTLGSSNLIEMGDEVKQIIRLTKNQGFVFVDSLEGLFIDNKQNDVSKFLRSIIVEATNCNSEILVIHSGGIDEKLIKNITPFFDKVINAEKNTK